MFQEEIDFLIEKENLDARANEHQKIADTAKLNANIDAIVKNAKKDAKRQGANSNKPVEGIQENRHVEKDNTRREEGWELGQDKPKTKRSKRGRGDDFDYVPAPGHINNLFDED